LPILDGRQKAAGRIENGKRKGREEKGAKLG
jgi:hypothetical protein